MIYENRKLLEKVFNWFNWQQVSSDSLICKDEAKNQFWMQMYAKTGDKKNTERLILALSSI